MELISSSPGLSVRQLLLLQRGSDPLGRQRLGVPIALECRWAAQGTIGKFGLVSWGGGVHYGAAIQFIWRHCPVCLVAVSSSTGDGVQVSGCMYRETLRQGPTGRDGPLTLATDSSEDTTPPSDKPATFASPRALYCGGCNDTPPCALAEEPKKTRRPAGFLLQPSTPGTTGSTRLTPSRTARTGAGSDTHSRRRPEWSGSRPRRCARSRRNAANAGSSRSPRP